MATRMEIKERAKAQLGNNIFGNTWLIALLVCLIVSAATTAVGTILPGLGAIIITGPLTYALALCFLKQARDGQAMNFADLLRGFQDDFGGTLLIGLMTTLFTALWSLLLVIPGIVKYYAYSQAYNVKIDHPDYDWRACIQESQRLMKGHKGELFIQDLSFIGWLIVGSLCLGVGTLWVAAYMNAARAQFYQALLENPQE